MMANKRLRRHAIHVCCMGVNGLEAANGWIFSEGFNGVSHIEYKVTAGKIYSA